MACKLREIIPMLKLAEALKTAIVMSDDPQSVWPRIHRTVSFTGVLTSSFILRVDVLPKSENDTTDRSSRQTDWCVNEVKSGEVFDVMVFRYIFSTSDLLPSFCSAKQTSTGIARV